MGVGEVGGKSYLLNVKDVGRHARKLLVECFNLARFRKSHSNEERVFVEDFSMASGQVTCVT